MAEFPIQRAPERLGVVPTTAVRANIDVSTGGQELGRAVAGLGGAIADIGFRWHLMEADTQLDNAIMQDGKEDTRYEIGLDAIQDTADETGLYKKAFAETMATREKFMPTNGVAARRYKSYLTRKAASLEQFSKLARIGKIKDNHRKVGFEKQIETIQSADANFEKKFIEYDTHLKKGIKLGAYDAEEAARLKQNTIDSHERYLKTQQVQAKEQLEIKREENRDTISKAIREGEDATAEIEGSLLDEKEQWSWFERQRIDLKRREEGADIITDKREEHYLLDLAGAINWPEQKISKAEVLRLANEARFPEEGKPTIDDTAYDGIRDAIRRELEDKIPFAQSRIETVIGELMTGSPSSVLGTPLPTLRDREDHIKYATQQFGRFTRRIPGVMEIINAKYPPPITEKPVDIISDNAAYDFDAELIGEYNPDGSISLNEEGARRLFELAGRDPERAREMALLNRYVLPETEEE